MLARRLTFALAAVSLIAAASAAAEAPELDTPHVLSTVAIGYPGKTGAIASSPASVKVTKCASSSLLANRRFYVQAHMSPVTGTKTMQLRFRFFQKITGQAEREIKVEGSVGFWEAPQSVAVNRNWIFNKQVDSLPAPASYRMEVDFQWLNGTRVLKSQTIKTPACAQTDQRPNLYISTATATRNSETGRVHYEITVRNSGKGTASASKVLLTILSPYSRVEAKTSSIKVGESQTVTFDAAPCSGGNALIEVDPGNLLGESSSADNVFSIGCAPA